MDTNNRNNCQRNQKHQETIDWNLSFSWNLFNLDATISTPTSHRIFHLWLVSTCFNHGFIHGFPMGSHGRWSMGYLQVISRTWAPQPRRNALRGKNHAGKMVPGCEVKHRGFIGFIYYTCLFVFIWKYIYICIYVYIYICIHFFWWGVGGMPKSRFTVGKFKTLFIFMKGTRFLPSLTPLFRQGRRHVHSYIYRVLF